MKRKVGKSTKDEQTRWAASARHNAETTKRKKIRSKSAENFDEIDVAGNDDGNVARVKLNVANFALILLVSMFLCVLVRYFKVLVRVCIRFSPRSTRLCAFEFIRGYFSFRLFYSFLVRRFIYFSVVCRLFTFADCQRELIVNGRRGIDARNHIHKVCGVCSSLSIWKWCATQNTSNDFWRQLRYDCVWYSSNWYSLPKLDKWNEKENDNCVGDSDGDATIKGNDGAKEQTPDVNDDDKWNGIHALDLRRRIEIRKKRENDDKSGEWKTNWRKRKKGDRTTTSNDWDWIIFARARKQHESREFISVDNCAKITREKR